MNVQHFFPDFDTPYEFDSIQDIVDKLNYSMGNPRWTSARAAHDMMLVDTLINLRGTFLKLRMETPFPSCIRSLMTKNIINW